MPIINVERKLYPKKDRFVIRKDNKRVYDLCIDKYKYKSRALWYLKERLKEAPLSPVEIVTSAYLIIELFETNTLKNYKELEDKDS